MQSAFVDVGDGTVHVRMAGSGPALVLIHQAPISARTLESRIERLSADFLCIAPDLPGLGQSDALGGGLVTVERMARTLIAVLDRLGIDKAVLYGQHTGALVATQIAIVAPERVAAVLVGGYPIYTPEESSQRVTSYAPPLAAPDWDGGHLSWLWYRYREQFIYWPWNSKEPRIRATCAIPSPAFLHAGAGEIATRHASYAAVYHAAFDYDAEGALARVAVPMHFILDLADSLSLKIELAAAANPSLKRWPGPTQEIEAIERRVALEAAAGLPAVSMPTLAGRSSRRAVADDGSVVLWRLNEGAGRPCLVLPPFPAGPRAVLLELQVGERREFLVTDFAALPGAGEEVAWIAGFAALVRRCVGDARLDLIASGGASAVAAALAEDLGAQLGTIMLVDQDDRSDGTPFDPAICASGGHMLRLWDRLRLERMRPPAATPEKPANVRGRYESLDLLGRTSWDAVQNLDRIPDWDRLVAALEPAERQVEGKAGVVTVATGIDARGAIPDGTRAARASHRIHGIVDAPFAAALALAGSR